MKLRPATTRWILAAIGSLLVVFGLACANFTKPGTLQHHEQWAADRGMPGPGDAVLWGGVGSAAAGAFLLGVSFGRRTQSLIRSP